MIRYLPELEPVPRETREMVRLLIQSMSLGPSLLTTLQESPITRVVRMPRFAQVGLTTPEHTTIVTSLEGRRVLPGKRDTGKPLAEKPRNAADGAITAFESIAARLRYVVSELRQIEQALGALPASTREAWQSQILEELRQLLPALETTAFDECDAARMKVPNEP